MRKNIDKHVFNCVGYFIILFFVFFCILPYILVISGSFTDESSIYQHGYNLFPKVFSLDAYKTIFTFPDDIIRSYLVTISLTATGTLLGLILTSMTSYVLQRQTFKSRNFFSLFFFFTTLFSGGLVSYYILISRYLNIKETYWALLLPPLFTVFDIIVVRTFMKSIPSSLAESGTIDGANEFTIFLKIYLFLSKPALATIGLFIALRYWNDWYNALLFVNHTKNLYPLQFTLYKMLTGADAMRRLQATAGMSLAFKFPSESYKLAMTIVATGPIIFLYPFLQKYFIKGLTIGAVKG